MGTADFDRLYLGVYPPFGFYRTLALAERLMTHKHDLMHKAVGWMLREVGKRDRDTLTDFLERYATQLPRTALRYAIEHFPKTGASIS